MFVTSDVIFHEKEMYFGASEPSLQGEFRDNEVRTFDYYPTTERELHKQDMTFGEEQQTTTSEEQQATEQKLIDQRLTEQQLCSYQDH